MSKTLLAVDDSATMRKVLEITFAGEDFTVVAADSHKAAIAKAGDAAVFVIDTVIGDDDGYALAKEIRGLNANAAIVLLSSRYAPYDADKGKDAGADDFADKPFDTQQLIDKVRKAVLARESGAGAAAAAPAAAAVPKATQPSLGGSRPRSATLVFGSEPEAAKPAAEAKAPAAEAKAPAAAPAASAATNGQIDAKLKDLGLSGTQADGVREIIERAVWELVPQIAESLIKAEIARLLKE